MTTSASSQGAQAPRPVIELQDLWDWAFCPMRAWWRKAGGPPADGFQRPPVTDALVERAVRQAIEMHYRAAKEGGKTVSLPQAFGIVWRGWLRDWTFDDDMVDDLLGYHKGRSSMLRRFGPDGDRRRPDGSLYRRPTWTREWRKLAADSGLDDLERKIDRAAEEVGIPRLKMPADGNLVPGMGFAQSFSVGLDTIHGLGDLPDAEEVLAVGSSVEADLLSARVRCRVDLVIDLGQKPLRGRPPKGSDGPRLGRRVGYEYYLFEEEPASAASLRNDLRVLALSQALPRELESQGDEVILERIVVRHMRSGQKESICPLKGEGAEVLDGLARAVLAGMNSGAYIPRMVCGWHACGDCEYRPLCFEGQGIMKALNPPVMSQIQSNQRFHSELGELLDARGGRSDVLAACRDFAGWMARTPGMTPEGALWHLSALESEVP